MQVNTTEALAADLATLREQVLDLGQALADMTVREARMRQVLKLLFGYTGEPGAGGPAGSRPALSLVRGDGAR